MTTYTDKQLRELCFQSILWIWTEKLTRKRMSTSIFLTSTSSCWWVSEESALYINRIIWTVFEFFGWFVDQNDRVRQTDLTMKRRKSMICFHIKSYFRVKKISHFWDICLLFDLYFDWNRSFGSVRFVWSVVLYTLGVSSAWFSVYFLSSSINFGGSFTFFPFGISTYKLLAWITCLCHIPLVWYVRLFFPFNCLVIINACQSLSLHLSFVFSVNIHLSSVWIHVLVDVAQSFI